MSSKKIKGVEKGSLINVKIPKKKPLKDKEVIIILREELKKKDDEIVRLREQNALLLNVSYKNAKRQLSSFEEDMDNI